MEETNMERFCVNNNSKFYTDMHFLNKRFEQIVRIFETTNKVGDYSHAENTSLRLQQEGLANLKVYRDALKYELFEIEALLLNRINSIYLEGN
jgi:hypothetical protein